MSKNAIFEVSLCLTCPGANAQERSPGKGFPRLFPLDGRGEPHEFLLDIGAEPGKCGGRVGIQLVPGNCRDFLGGCIPRAGGRFFMLTANFY